MLYPVPMESKNKPQDLCKGMLFFEGDVTKDKSTKQKMPIGYGKLFVKGYDGYNMVDNIAIIGNFDGQSVINASFCINDNGRCNWNNEYNKYTIKNERVFNGKISYNYSYDNDTKKLYLTVNLLEGELFSNPSNSIKNIPITPEDDLQYKMAFEKSDRVPYNRRFNVNPLTIRFTSKNNTDYTDAVFSILNPIIEENYWEATNTGDWETKWIGGKLKNGQNLKVLSYKFSDGSCLDFKIEGTNDIHAHSEGIAGKLPLSDGGYLSWTDRGKSMQLQYPTGEIYSGSFDKIPFKLEYITGHCNADLYATAVKNIIESSSSDFVISTGTFIDSTGKSERVQDGKFVNRLINNNDSSSLDYATLIAGAIPLSTNNELYVSLCQNDFWKYIGKGDISDLDKAIYKETPAYAEQYKAFQEDLNGLFYEVIPCKAYDFTTSGATVYQRNQDEILGVSPLLHIPQDQVSGSSVGRRDCALPLKNSCLVKLQYNCGVNLPIKSTDINFLSYLQNINNSDDLGLLCIMKPGIQVNSDFGSYNYIVTPVSLYLIDKNTNSILADFTQYIDTDKPSKYKKIFSQREASVKAEKKKQTDAAIKEYKRSFGANASPCATCAGTGRRTYTSSTTGQQYKKVCNVCGGTGRIYKR